MMMRLAGLRPTTLAAAAAAAAATTAAAASRVACYRAASSASGSSNTTGQAARATDAASATTAASSRVNRSSLNYTQGQTVKGRREYFYYIDHNGFLFLDDSMMKNFTSCLKDKPFLDFFFKRVEPNTTGRYEEEFPFLSRCGREFNFLRCDDTPLVYHTLLPPHGSLVSDKDQLDQYIKSAEQGDANPGSSETATGTGQASDEPWELVYAGNLRRPFEPDKLCMTETARLYHPSPDGKELYLVASPLAIKLSRRMVFGSDATLFSWQGNTYNIDIRIPEADERE
ncbi:hypothetical protein PTSG_12491 [Salpingoeca rosetta]|uniref:Uncharacterized protein n=1 Tax=Salpingoeca rosetta (strain ATCC 50818 / BSB-021) TaxID=946362 RepID=F2UEX5_SALR5|nr:uncharacterized protein PTSG_12491 [Salpingoeca rosetta]EGD75175.1 hypothetical protein PTSG_12491 [Salpingoeca rosetta]|eukprot:XP_004992228.1 hypothetical protein PTSG_12491 [Salpingoeca rosetta]